MRFRLAPRRFRYQLLHLTFLTIPAIGIAAEEDNKSGQMQSVEVSAPDGNSQRRNDTAAKIVIQRAEILQYGDAALSEVLKRQPGVSLVGNELRLRGLGAGYTQILLNGEPVPPGFSIDSLSPELIERIEILRTTSAEYSAQAIAGSINIVLRKSVSQASQKIKLGAEHDAGGLTPSLSLDMTDRSGALSYSLNGTLNRTRYAADPLTTERISDADGQLSNLRQFHEHFETQLTQINLAPRLSWKLPDGDQISWQSLLTYGRNLMHGNNRETTLSGDPSDYPQNDYRLAANTTGIRSDLSWSHRINADIKIDAKAGINYNKRESNYYFDGYPPESALPFIRNVVSDALDQSLSASGKALWRLNDAHSLAFGWDGGLITRSESRLQYDTQPGSRLTDFLDEDYRAQVRRLALFTQDEWDISPRWQAYLGLRWEGLHTAITGRSIVDTETRSSVFSPVLQALWKLPDTEKDQIRFALSRTYKAPTTRNLVPRRYTVNNDNNPNNSDFQGNPHLLPELAWGLDVAYEHYVGKNGVVSLSGFAKRISNVTTFQLFQQDGEWVTSPANQGRAEVYGMEMDAKLPLSAWLDQAPPVDVHMNLSRNWSRIDSVPGPDNRLASQVPYTLNLGADYRRNDRHSMGLNLNWQGGGRVQTSDVLATYSGVRRTLDAYSVWKLEQGMSLRLSVANALHQPQLAAQTYTGSGDSRRSSVTPSSATLRILLEKSL